MIDGLIALERLLQPTIVHLKAVHIVALLIWCGGLLAVPFMLAHLEAVGTARDFPQIRRATHLLYTGAITPAAVTTVIAGTWLVFLRDTFTTWFYLKLLMVALLVSGHAWIGHLLAKKAVGQDRPIAFPHAPAVVVLVPMLAILVLVLAKPDLGSIEFPQWMTEPRGGQLPFDIPRR